MLSDPRPTIRTVPEFSDFAAKLLVLDQLCYALKLLPPYPGDQPDDYSPTYRNPEAVAYYRDLVIPDEVLGRVTEVLLDGGNSIYFDVAPHWDGEDDSFDVREWGELAALPALEVVRSSGVVPAAGRRLLRERGIVVDDDADVAVVSRVRTYQVDGRPVRLSVEHGYEDLAEELVARFAGVPDGEVVRFGCGRFVIGVERGRAAVLSPLVFWAHPAERWPWHTNLSRVFRLTRAQRAITAAAPPDLADGVDVEVGAERARRVVLRRREPVDGHSGWEVRADPATGAGVVTRALGCLVGYRPGALPAIALPPGAVVALDVDEITSVSGGGAG
ncbi:hypothetical protein CNX65_17105 [Actinosynnema pretiosum]|uniref:DUF6892 domain-containing protein n=1 Tax=Actinosynnema pretiosum TaxID=42197 RepID=A0A290Z717_9PSEU|nr:hypothetical protein CNX65_17105 [Actinosynnema pretiosum]